MCRPQKKGLGEKTMKQVVLEKSNVAWFKLAEFVARGEKERALSFYRLLSHSITNPAIVAQLEGDLLYAFHDERAIEAYRRAIDLYDIRRGTAHVLALYFQMIKLLVEHARYSDIHDLITTCALPTESKIRIHKYCIGELLKDKNPQHCPYIEAHIREVLDHHILNNACSNELTAFMGLLAAHNSVLHNYACDYITR